MGAGLARGMGGTCCAVMGGKEPAKKGKKTEGNGEVGEGWG